MYNLFKEIDEILLGFKNAFSREKSFQWFCIVIYGLLFRFDSHGVTSFIRCFNLKEKCYEQILNFFHSSSWCLRDITYYWIKGLMKRVDPYRIEGHLLFVGDATMVTKEGRRMPAVKKLHDSSQNTNRPKYFFGHYFGFISLVIVSPFKLFALPIVGEIQDGIKSLRKYQHDKKIPMVNGQEDITTVTLMVEMACRFVRRIQQNSLVVLDGYYATKKTFLMAWNCLNDKGEQILQVLVRMKKSTVAYLESPRIPNKERGSN